MAITVMMMSEGSMEPRAATMPPSLPRYLRPTKAAVLTMIMPGRHWAMA